MNSYHALDLKGAKGESTARLKEFLKERIVFELKVSAGTREYEILQAVLKSTFDDLADAFERYEILKRDFQNDPKMFLKTAKVVERTSNILKGIKGKMPEEIRSELLREALEKELFDLLEKKSGEIQTAIRNRDYSKATKIFGESFYRPLHSFFEKILVNAEDSQTRQNRQALMRRINSLYADTVADLSVLSRIDIE